MNNIWLLFTFAAMLLWGLWGFFSKLATSFLSDTDAVIYHSIGSVLVVVIAALFLGFQPKGKPIGIFYAVLSGVFAASATFFFYSAITRGRSVVVVSMTALYPLITLGLSTLFLHEVLTLKQLLGVGLALGAIILLSS
ncbi:MAG: DMT family transporter [Anaerolineae bacterium]|jgi:bacterial/archaeal transporter family protein|nr:DMT family transporter [Anaerolineae bacterium]MBT7075587.1 DMT family transporter [Anaerolineae bacterium]MBT7782392.1 DMT family transporter [Anaerolineae bacterium]